jgi:polyphosphate kinase 2 (PPK2 family)
MGFCSEPEYLEFLRSCPDLERMLVRSGIKLVKYWFSVSSEEQERRFMSRIEDRTKRWKLSDVDLASRSRWHDYSQAKDQMFLYTDTVEAPWYVVNGDDKKRARLNCIHHLLSQIPYQEMEQEKIELPARQRDTGYQRPSQDLQKLVPEVY